MSHQSLGARGTIEDAEPVVRALRDWAQARRAEVLAVDARVVFGRDHLESAIFHAERAKATNAMSAHSLSLETLLYLSGRRQVVDAIRVAGLRKGTRTIGLAVWNAERPEELLKALGWSRDDGVLESAGKSLELLGITEQEEGTVVEIRRADLALEKVALLDIEK